MKTTFTDDVGQRVDDYNPYPLLAFLSVLFALLCCILALFNSRLIALPMFSALFGMFALYRLFANDMRRGYRMAGFAFLSSLFVFSSTVGYQSLRYRNLAALANQHCDTWLDLIREGRTLDAYELTVKFHDRHDEGTNLSKIYGNPDTPQPGLENYLKVEPESSIRKLGMKAKLTKGKTGYFRVDSFHERFEIHRYLDRSHESKTDFHFCVIMERTRPINAEVYWEVVDIVNIAPPTPRSDRQIGTAGPGDRKREIQ